MSHIEGYNSPVIANNRAVFDTWPIVDPSHSTPSLTNSSLQAGLLLGYGQTVAKGASYRRGRCWDNSKKQKKKKQGGITIRAKAQHSMAPFFLFSVLKIKI